MYTSIARARLALFVAPWLAVSFVLADEPAAKPLATANATVVPSTDRLPTDKSAPPETKSDPQSETPNRTALVLFITTKDCPKCDEALNKLRRAGGDFDSMRRQGWKIGETADNHLQIVDRDAVAELVERLAVNDFPAVVAVENGEIVRSFKSGCTTPLDAWTFGFLAKGVDERPKGSVPEAARVETTGHYPLRGNHWSVDEDWSPSRDKVVGHLRGPNHGHQIRAHWAIETWSYEELRSLHDNLHEQEMGGVSFSSNRSQPTSQFSAARKAGGK